MSERIRVARALSSGGFCLCLLAAGSSSVFAQSGRELESLVFSPTTLSGHTDSVAQDDHVQYRTVSSGAGVMAMSSGKIPAFAPSVVHSAPAMPGNSLADLEDSLFETEMQEGSYSEALVTELLTAGKLLQEQQAHQQALALYERAIHILRVNEGLGSLRQLPVIEQRLASLKTLRRYGEVEKEYRHMLSVLQEHYGVAAIETVQARRGLAEWKMEIFSQGIRYDRKGDELPFEGRSFSDDVEVRRASFEELMLAQEEILEAIRLLVKAEAYDHEDLQALEEMLVETYFMSSYQHELIFEPGQFMSDRMTPGDSIRHLNRNDDRSRTMAFRNGSNAYQRILAYMQKNADTTAITDYAGVIIKLADWHILFDHRSEALELYQRAEEILVANEMSEQTIAQLLNPGIPVALPAFASLPQLASDSGYRDETEESYRGYVDVTFELNRYGRASKVNVLDSTDDTSNIVQSRLVSMVRDTRFRPRIADSEVVDEPMHLRYYYNW